MSIIHGIWLRSRLQGLKMHKLRDRKAGDDMLLKCVNTGSQNGNCYILENDTEALILDAGVRYKDVLKALDYNISKVTATLLSHEHS